MHVKSICFKWPYLLDLNPLAAFAPSLILILLLLALIRKTYRHIFIAV